MEISSRGMPISFVPQEVPCWNHLQWPSVAMEWYLVYRACDIYLRDTLESTNTASSLASDSRLTCICCNSEEEESLSLLSGLHFACFERVEKSCAARLAIGSSCMLGKIWVFVVCSTALFHLAVCSGLTMTGKRFWNISCRTTPCPRWAASQPVWPRNLVFERNESSLWCVSSTYAPFSEQSVNFEPLLNSFRLLLLALEIQLLSSPIKMSGGSNDYMLQLFS